MVDHVPILLAISKLKSQKKWIVSILILMILVLSLAYFYLRPQSLEYYIVSGRDVTETLVTSGRAESVQNLELAFEVSGIVEEVLFQEGDKVNSNDTIVKLKADQEKTKLALLKQQLTVAQQKAREIVEQRRFEVEQKQKEYENLQALEKLGAVSKEELQNSKISADTAVSNLALAEIELNDTSLYTNGSSQAQLQLEQARISLDNKALISPIQGTILSIAKQPGEYITPGITVAKVSSNNPLISLEIDEKQYDNLQIGQKVLISSQADPEPILEGKISSISADVDSIKGTITVKCSLNDSTTVLKPGSAVNAEIILGQIQNALTVPLEYILIKDKDKGVMAWQNNQPVFIPVQIVKTINGYSVIKGPEEGTIIIEPTQIKENRYYKLGQQKEI